MAAILDQYSIVAAFINDS